MIEVLLGIVAMLLGVAVWLLVDLRQRAAGPPAEVLGRFEQLERAEERTERAVREELAKSREEAVGSGRHLREELASSLKGMGDSFEKRHEALRGVVDTRLQQLHEESGKKLDAMRQTVDEKLQGTLEKRLGEAFQQVSERLEAVHKGLGEMQTLAVGVGDLKKVLSNVRARGAFGELQLGALLEQILSPGQYERQVATRPESSERVDFAIRMPGPQEGGSIWLPIDSKFPQDDYERLVDAHEQGDAVGAEQAARALETRIKTEAKSIREKYVQPPATTDFAILFLPTEGLYAEVLRRNGLVEGLQRDYRITIAGPTTLAAFLNSLQMGFRTLAIQKRSDEVWHLLGAVRTQFGKFGDLLAKVDKKLQEASNTIGDATRKTRYIEGRLRRVEALPDDEAHALLPELAEGDEPLPTREGEEIP
jgi:DNA recombination protein RmuC